MKSLYREFASVYDRLMEEYPYPAVFHRIKELFARDQLHPRHLVEGACGTGELTGYLAEISRVIGFDLSQEMLSLAEQKHRGNGKIQLVKGDLRDFRLPEKTDGVFCLCDGLNYVKPEELDKVMETFDALLGEEGRFFIDWKTEAFFLRTQDCVEVYDEEDFFGVWTNEYRQDQGEHRYFLDLFFPEDHRYRRVEEVHIQYKFDMEEIKAAGEKRGFTMEFFHEYTGEAPGEDSLRISAWGKRRK